MRVSRNFGKTVREDPAEAETPSHRLLLKSGMIQQIASGIYSYSPLAQKSLIKIQTIIRQEMDATGGQEVHLPSLQPLDLWESTGRSDTFGPDLLRLQDRKARDMVIAPTHEEAVTLLVRQFIESYRDLPVLLYQIQTKFRDEPRPRAGLIRVREFEMKDAYSFDTDDDGLGNSYNKMIQVYKNIFKRCSLPALIVEADSGAIGGKDSHEFILANPVGEDTIIQCLNCGYAANVERAISLHAQTPVEAPMQLEKVYTPEISTIEDLANSLSIPKSKTLKSVFYHADGAFVFAIIRGDLEINEAKLRRVLGAKELRLATIQEVVAAGLVPGFASPFNIQGVQIIADTSLEHSTNLLAGANQLNYHFRNANHPRDFLYDKIEDIALSQGGDACVHCNESLTTTRGIEIGHVFKLGTLYSELLDTWYRDTNGEQQLPVMGCYGIGIGRLFAAVIEEHHDERGMCLPINIAPYHVYLIAINPSNPSVKEISNTLYDELLAVGIEVLFDDRDESSGVKFNDADLLGIPLRIVVSPRNVEAGVVEIKERKSETSTFTPLEFAVKETKDIISN